MTTIRSVASRFPLSWLLVPGLLLAMVVAFAITAAEASGDEFGDSADQTGGVDGVLDDVLGPPDGTIVQIGTDGSGGGGSVTVSFDNNVAFDGPGADIRVYVVDALFPATATIEVSADGVTWIAAGDFPDTANIDIDLGALPSPLPFAVAVRVTQLSGELPGFDLDAIEALNELDLEDTLLDAAPDADANPGFTMHTITATLTELGVAVAGVPVSFLVSTGPNTGDGIVGVTDAAGMASFDYTGDGGPGLDAVTAWLDIDGNGAPDTGEPAEVVTKLWNGVTGTIELNDLDGGGVASDDVLEVVVDDKDLDVSPAADTVQVVVTSTSDPTGLTALTLTETGPSTGIFSANVTLAAATNELQAANGDTITASYDDAFDGEGNDPAPVDASLDILASDEEEEEEKVTICHLPGGNPGNQHTITVGAPATDAHLAHGDSLGECDEATAEPTKQEQALEAFCERRSHHARCDELNGDSTESAVDLEGDSESVDAADNGSAKQDQQLKAFCERKPDHKRCDNLVTAGSDD